MNNIYLDKINYYNKKNNIYKLNKYVYKYYNLYGGVGENNPLSIIGNKITLQSKNIISNLSNQSKNIINMQLFLWYSQPCLVDFLCRLQFIFLFIHKCI